MSAQLLSDLAAQAFGPPILRLDGFEFVIFDVSDQILDSLVILDNFEWSIDASSVGTHTG